MVEQMAALLGIIGADFAPPVTLADFFVYFFKISLSFCVVAGLFQLLRWVAEGVAKGGRNL